MSRRETSCCLDSAFNVLPAMNSSAMCRLNAALWDWCFVVASILRKPSSRDQTKSSKLFTVTGALQYGGPIYVSIDRRRTNLPKAAPA